MKWPDRTFLSKRESHIESTHKCIENLVLIIEQGTHSDLQNFDHHLGMQILDPGVEILQKSGDKMARRMII